MRLIYPKQKVEELHEVQSREIVMQGDAPVDSLSEQFIPEEVEIYPGLLSQESLKTYMEKIMSFSIMTYQRLCLLKCQRNTPFIIGFLFLEVHLVIKSTPLKELESNLYEWKLFIATV